MNRFLAPSEFARFGFGVEIVKLLDLHHFIDFSGFRDAVNMNMGGTVRVLELANEMRSLASLVHISTAYTNCTREEVDEKIYE